MALPLAGIILTALAAFAVWWAADRLWHALAIVVLALPVFPFAATQLPAIGDISRYLPGGTFSSGSEGKDQIVIASAAASFLVAVVLAACIWGLGKAAIRQLRALPK